MKLRGLMQKLIEDPPPRCSAVIVAAGSSVRMGSDKLLAPLGGMPVLARTLLAFQRSPLVEEIVLVVREDRLQEMADLCAQYRADKVSKVVVGGKTRAESALAGVSQVRRGAKLIALHDGARPLVTEDVIQRTVYAARDAAGAAPAVMSVDTLKALDEDGFITATVDRKRTCRIQTPQVFRTDLIKGALTKAVSEGIPITDDCAALELLGFKCRAVLGGEDNIKITTPRDLILAEAILRDREAQP